MKLSCLVMTGGKGTRLEADVEKPLLELEGRFLIDYIIEAVNGCKYIDRFWAVTSPGTKMTEEYLKEKSVKVLQAPGEGYVGDLVFAIKSLGLGKTLTLSADLPLLTSRDLNWVIEEYLKAGQPALAVTIPIDLIEKSGMRAETIIDGYAPAGINVVDGKNLNGSEFKLVTKEPRFAVNVNTIDDSKVAQRRIRNAH